MRMRSIRLAALWLWSAAATVLSLALAATPAQAQLTRSWVANSGNDANNCSRDAPCKSFAGAQLKTVDGGEINCIDPGGYGSIVITQSLTIDCTGTLGSILNSSAIGLGVDAPGKNVIVRGLHIVGAGFNPTAAGTRGIRILAADSVIVENVWIQDQLRGAGIEIRPSTGTTSVFINDTIVANSGNGSNAGIQVTPSGSALVRLSMDGVKVLGTNGNALRLDSTGTTGLGILTIIENSTLSNSSGAGISLVAGSAPSPFNVALVNNSNISNNGGAGISASGAAARVRVANSALSLNGTGISPGTGFINDLGGNLNVGNSADGAFN